MFWRPRDGGKVMATHASARWREISLPNKIVTQTNEGVHPRDGGKVSHIMQTIY
jgi:hypothetical protein